MKIVEKHIISKNHKLYKELDVLCFKNKNIYNRTLYLIKKDLEQNSYNVLNDLYPVMKNEDCFKELPVKVAQNTLRSIYAIYKAFFKSIKSPNVNHVVRQPKYLDKTNGRFFLTFNNQTISKKVFVKTNKIKLSGCDIEFLTKITDFNSINCVRIIPGLDQYTIEVIHEIEEVKPLKYNGNLASIDLGVNNLSMITSNVKGFRPVIINGKPLKSINQFFNKKLSYYKSKLEKNGLKSSHRTKRLNNKRTNKINDYIHKSSKEIVMILKDNDITKLVIGKNKEWKQDCNIGKRNNQNFVSIPHSRFIDTLVYKCERAGIKVDIIEESYTSKCSFLDREPICKHEVYLGRRVKRGLFVSSDGTKINADVNGSYNIMLKAVPDSLDGIEVRSVPVVMTMKLN